VTSEHPTAIAIADPTVLIPWISNILVSPFRRKSIVSYNPPPGTSGIIPTIKKIVAGVLNILARISDMTAATSVAIKHLPASDILPFSKIYTNQAAAPEELAARINFMLCTSNTIQNPIHAQNAYKHGKKFSINILPPYSLRLPGL
jgi:hypothetical protein